MNSKNIDPDDNAFQILTLKILTDTEEILRTNFYTGLVSIICTITSINSLIFLTNINILQILIGISFTTLNGVAFINLKYTAKIQNLISHIKNKYKTAFDKINQTEKTNAHDFSNHCYEHINNEIPRILTENQNIKETTLFFLVPQISIIFLTTGFAYWLLFNPYFKTLYIINILITLVLITKTFTSLQKYNQNTPKQI